MTDAERNTLRLVAHDAIDKLWRAGDVVSLLLLQQQLNRSIDYFGSMRADTECQTCGIGYRLPSGRCDHCDTMFESS